jgi:hypothetical protein
MAIDAAGKVQLKEDKLHGAARLAGKADDLVDGDGRRPQRLDYPGAVVLAGRWNAREVFWLGQRIG